MWARFWLTLHRALVAVHYFGWHSAFLFTGFFWRAWILLWFIKYRKPAEHPALSAAELAYINQGSARRSPPPSYAVDQSCLAIRQTWAFAIPKFLTDPIWWFYLFWLPSYFSDKFHLNLVASWDCRS